MGLGLGLTALSGATEDSPFFAGASDVQGTFLAFLLRPQIDVGYDLTSRFAVVLTPFALDYSPAFRTFTNDEVSHVVRLHFAVGVSLLL